MQFYVVMAFGVLICTNLVHNCGAVLLQSGGAATQQDWILVVLNIWLLSIITLALWRFMHSTRADYARANIAHNARGAQAIPVYTPVGEVPLQAPRPCPGAPRRRRNVPRHYNPMMPLNAALQHAQTAAMQGGWAPQYHTHIYCHGIGHPHNPTLFEEADNGYGQRRRPDRVWRGQEVPRLRRRFSPVGDFSSVSLNDSNEPSPVPLNTPEGSVDGEAVPEDHVSNLSSTHSFFLQPPNLSPILYNISQEIDNLSTSLSF